MVWFCLRFGQALFWTEWFVLKGFVGSSFFSWGSLEFVCGVFGVCLWFGVRLEYLCFGRWEEIVEGV